MTTANDARKAHKILDALFKGKMVLDEEREFLRGFLPELPKQMTLEEIHKYVDDAWLEADDPELKEWLHELHFQLKGLEVAATIAPGLPAGMRIAEHENFGRVVVSPGVGIDRCHEIFYLDPGMSSGTDISEVEPDSLTFIDAEPAKPTHPEFLETEADYKNAPVGTVAARDNGLPWVKEKSNYWTRPDAAKSDYGMSLCSRRILRWGNE